MRAADMLADLRAQAARHGAPLARLAVRRVLAHLPPLAAVAVLAALIVAALTSRRRP